MKSVVYEVSYIRNLQYDIERIAKKLESFEPAKDIENFKVSLPKEVKKRRFNATDILFLEVHQALEV